MDKGTEFRNSFGDTIVYDGQIYCKGGGYEKLFTIHINGKYIKKVGGLNVAKSFINKERGIKCKWFESNL